MHKSLWNRAFVRLPSVFHWCSKSFPILFLRLPFNILIQWSRVHLQSLTWTSVPKSGARGMVEGNPCNASLPESYVEQGLEADIWIKQYMEETVRIHLLHQPWNLLSMTANTFTEQATQSRFQGILMAINLETFRVGGVQSTKKPSLPSLG